MGSCGEVLRDVDRDGLPVRAAAQLLGRSKRQVWRGYSRRAVCLRRPAARSPSPQEGPADNLIHNRIEENRKCRRNVQMSVPSNLKMSVSPAFGGPWGAASMAVLSIVSRPDGGPD
jgi:hypothetical protein